MYHPGMAVNQDSIDVICLRTYIVNVYFVIVEPHKWVLIDTGLLFSAKTILQAANDLFGENNPPQAIILTHGHFDHVGSVKQLAEHWNVPVYAHELETPYLTGGDYPPPDPTVGGGLMARLAGLYPYKGINIENRLVKLPDNGRIPSMPGWRWIYTPGHTIGHISLFRDSDRFLIAGDAITTVKQESALAVLTQYKKLHGPPSYFTINWETSRDSVRYLASLKPNVAATGHGIPMAGDMLTQQLDDLVKNFKSIAVPEQGRFVQNP
ncbi:MBL fold metallo-hydrolase [Scopulibacillus cellulosilyticus]|uniref:MBL fold metallo-hydrolase n=1 Tax=Scopulibacillus cellulosilyticus TaxID=2665665 RepID=A0ABW2PS60_9BACL